MRLFKTRFFAKWAHKEKLLDRDLAQASQEIERGLVEANLGGNVYKKRISLKGQGKRGGARTIVAYKTGKKIFFIFGFSKNERSNIGAEELKIAKALAKELLAYSTEQLNQLVKDGKLREVKLDG